MIQKLSILYENKIMTNNFSIKLVNNNIIIDSIELKNKILQVPIYNKFNGIDYFTINFPLNLPVIKNTCFNPYIILSSFNLELDNDLDFFYQINKLLNQKFNLKLLTFKEILDEKFNLSKIIHDNYLECITLENIKNITNLHDFISTLWFNINIIKLLCIWTLIKFQNISNKNIKDISSNYNIPKKILVLSNNLRLIKYNLSLNIEHSMTLIDYLNHNFNSSIKLLDIKPNNSYYLLINKYENSTTEIVDTNIHNLDKVIKIFIKKITKNIIILNDDKNIIFENYKWYYFHPNIKIDNEYIYYQTFINQDFTSELIKNLLNLDLVHSKKIIEYYSKDFNISNLVSLSNIFSYLKTCFQDFDILKLNSYSDGFFEYITKKYSNNEDNKIYEILSILFNNYNYPLKNTRHDLDNIFDQIIYFSLYNNKFIFVNNKVYETYELLHPNINCVIPSKLKNLYINLIKGITQIINNDFETITYNQKFYSDYLHRNIIKILLSNNNHLSNNLIKNLISTININKFKSIISTNILLADICNKLTWTNLPKKLNYLNIFYKNHDIVHFQDKINKNIIPDNFDIRIKKVIENPFEMFKFLRKEKDFIKWTKFISDKLIQLYYIPISLSSDDFELIGKLIYLLFNINEQNIKDPSYINFINFCNLNNKLILDSNRINLKIKEYFTSLKININLGFLAKHLTWDKESITFEEISNLDKTPDVLALEMKLHIATKKYYKYKAKYLESKDDEDNTSIVNFQNNNKKNLLSDTSSILDGSKILNKNI
jgi:hypothetical protein